MSTRRHFRDLTTDEDIQRALDRAATFVDPYPSAVSVEYRPDEDVVMVSLSDGTRLSIPRRVMQGLEGASERDLAQVEILGSGLRWERLNVDHYVPSLVEGIFGNRRWMSELGKKGGASRSEAKTAAARENGKKGGRPKLARKPA